MSKCSCGTWNVDNAKYCRNCGKKLSDTTSTQSNHNYQSSTSSNSSSDSGYGWVIGLIILGILCAIFYKIIIWNIHETIIY